MDAKTTTKKKAGPLKFSEGYTSVTDMVRGTVGDSAAEKFREYSDARRLMNCLTVLRCAKEVSQAELASRMGCGQPKVSKMEASADDELNFGDIISYATSLKMGIHLTFSPSQGNASNRIKFHLDCMRREIDTLVKRASDDPRFSDGVEAFALDTVQRMISLIEGSLEKVPHRSQPSDSVTVEVENDHGEPITLDPPKPTPKKAPRRAAKKVIV